MFLGREPCNENFLSGSAIASDGKNIEYSRRLAENFRLRNVGACLPIRKFPDVMCSFEKEKKAYRLPFTKWK